ncbi:MAG: MATE family efflux transporter, partial [Candidatus Ventricola sp.]
MRRPVKPERSTLMTEGPIARQLIAFALPLMLGNLFQQLYNTADSLIVGNFLGSEALAAVSSSSNLIHLLIGFFNGLAAGAGVVVSRHYGARDTERVQRSIHTMLAVGLAAGLLLTAAGVSLTPILLRMMGTPEGVLPQSISYFRTYFFGSMAFVLYNVCMGILQAVGDSRHPLYYLILSSVINIGLDLLFVGVLGLGVGSAAAATAISQIISTLLCLYRLTRSDRDYRVRLRCIGFDPRALREILANGVPAGLANSIIAVANVVVQANINAFGAAAMAGCGAHSRIEGFTFLPITCFNMALTTFVGQNLGAKRYDRVKQGVRVGLGCTVALAECIGVLIFIFSPHLIALFDRNPEVIAYGVMHQRTVALFS